MVCDRDLYRAEQDTVNLFVAAPDAPANLRLVIEHNGQYLIGVTDPESSLFPLIAERADYDAQHLSPQELTALLPERFEKYLKIVDKRSRIVIEAPSETAQQMLQELKRADQPVPQVRVAMVVHLI